MISNDILTSAYDMTVKQMLDLVMLRLKDLTVSYLVFTCRIKSYHN